MVVLLNAFVFFSSILAWFRNYYLWVQKSPCFRSLSSLAVLNSANSILDSSSHFLKTGVSWRMQTILVPLSTEYHHESTLCQQNTIVRAHPCSESTQKTALKTLKHRKADLFIYAAFRNLCFKCTNYFSFRLSQSKGHSLNCLSTVIAQTTVRKHEFQHLKHKKRQTVFAKAEFKLNIVLRW